VVYRLLGIRKSDGRDTAVGFATLFLVMAGHATLEAARDALFLATLPATLLPWAYLAMAVLALLATRLNRAALARFSRRRALSTSLLVGAAITVCFWIFSSLAGSAFSLVAFYVWTGLLATVVVVQFWLLLGDVVDLAQAKRIYAVIGAGGLAGATLGSAMASGLLLFLPSQSLLFSASACLVAASFLPALFSRRTQVDPRARRDSEDEPAKASQKLRNDPYLRRLLLLVLLATMTVTGIDYVFKAVVAREIEPARLGDFFARYYAIINGLALLVQLFLAPRLLRVVGVNRTLLVMPALLLLGSAGFVAAVGLAMVIVLKGADGALRHSLNRTGTEILYLPLSSSVRERFMALAEALAQRGGQALASLLILVAIFSGLTPAHMGVALFAMALLWLMCVVGLQPAYLELFRRQLRRGAIETRAEVPDLDLQTLEALISALSSDDDAEVVAALDMFATYERQNLIPALILYHPSRQVVLRAFELFDGSRRSDVQRLARRLLRHPDHEVRAAALRLYAASDPAQRPLRRCLQDESAGVRATAIVGLIASGFMSHREGEPALREVLDGPSADARQALALSLRLLPPERYAWVGRELAGGAEPGVAPLAGRSMAASPSVEHIPALLELLARHEGRAEARAALRKLGSVALDHLERAMQDPSLPRALRRHLPRTISRFENARAARLLVRFVCQEADEIVEYKILRGLGRMRQSDPSLPIDRAALIGLARDHLTRAVRALAWRLSVDWVRKELPRTDTSAAELLSELLRDLESSALERVFRLLHIIRPTEELIIIYDGLRSGEPALRAGGRELLEHVVVDELRAGVLALVDDAPDSERLRAAAAFYEPPSWELMAALRPEAGASERKQKREARIELAYAALLREMLNDRSGVLRSVAGYHLAELRLGEPGDKIAEAALRRGGTSEGPTERAMRLLEGLGGEVRHAAS
jgi:AAA family ATP:ADP antiporter